MDSKRLGMIHSIILLLLLASASVWAAERASFGVMIGAVTAEYAQFIGLTTPEGAYVVSTSAAGDLRPGDVILKVDDRNISVPADLREVTKQYQPGDQVQLQIARSKERIQISYTLKRAAVSQGTVRPGQPTRATVGLGFIPTIESARFEQEVLKSDQPVLAYFYANWCAPCKMYLPVLQQTMDRYPEIKIVGIDVDKSGDIVAHYGISRVLPTVILFNGGREVDKFSGGVSRKQVDELVAKTRNDSNEIEVFPSVGRGDYIVQVAFIKNSPLIAARDDGQRVFVWNYQQGALVRTYRAAATGLSPDGAYAALTDKKRTAVQIVDIVQQQQKTIQTQQFVEKLAISPLGTVVANFGADQSGQFSVDIWNPANKLIKSIPVDHTTNPKSVMFVFSPDGAHFALSTLNKLELFSTENWVCETVVPMKGTAAVLQFTSDSKAVSIPGKDEGLIDLQGKTQRGFNGRVVIGRPDDRLFVVGDGDNSFRLVSDRSFGKGLRFVGHRAGVTAAAVGDAVPWLASGSPDGTVRLWDPATGRAVGQFVGFANGEWIVITPEGYYNSSARGHEYLSIRRGNKVYGIDQFYDVFYRPDIVSAKLKGEDITGLVTLTVEEAIKNPPPAVKFSTVPNQTSDPKVKVCYQVQSTGGGIGEVRLFQNGKLIKSDGFYRDVAAQSTAATMKLAQVNSRAVYQDMRSLTIREKQSPGAVVNRAKGELVDECVEMETIAGENEISLTAFNAPNTVQSVMGTARFISTRAPDEPRLYILAVGIDRYRDASINLKYAAKDARDFIAQLSDKAKTIYHPSNIHLTTLVNEQAGKPNILAAIDKLAAQVKHGDSFIFFNASHGLLLQSQYYIVTGSFAGSLDRSASLISSNEIVEMSKKIKALSQLFIFDTCHAGGVDTIVSGLYDARMSVLAKKMGLHIYASAGSVETALDGYQGNGLYTHSLLEGLKNGEAVDKNKSGMVTVKSLGIYSREMTAEISNKLGHPQIPVIINFGKDSSLFIVR
ncbi:MAG: thioredoxin domain-containing protein [Smithellaceae bacterium]|nr:thioredoxin domain-containing protein [Smithellaceae bacterium]